MKRAWDFFLKNAGGLMLGTLVVLAGSLTVVLGPWFAFNLLQEVLESARHDRPVRWQATYERQGNFWRSWGLTLAMGIPLLIGYSLLIVPGVLLSLYWLHAPVLVADGRPVLDALTESGRIFRRRNAWDVYFLNWLILAILWAVGGITAIALVGVVPLTLVYLVLCYSDEIGRPIRMEPPRVQIPASPSV